MRFHEELHLLPSNDAQNCENRKHKSLALPVQALLWNGSENSVAPGQEPRFVESQPFYVVEIHLKNKLLSCLCNESQSWMKILSTGASVYKERKYNIIKMWILSFWTRNDLSVPIQLFKLKVVFKTQYLAFKCRGLKLIFTVHKVTTLVPCQTLSGIDVLAKELSEFFLLCTHASAHKHNFLMEQDFFLCSIILLCNT